MRELLDNNYAHGYEDAMEEKIEDVCFDRCIEIIKEALNTGTQQIIEGVAGTSLSP